MPGGATAPRPTGSRITAMALFGRIDLAAGPMLILVDAALAAAAWPVAASLALSDGGGGAGPPPGPGGRLLIHLLYPAAFLLFLYALGL